MPESRARRSISLPMPAPHHNRGRYSAYRASPVEVAGEKVRQALMPEVQARREHVEWGDGEEIGVERRRALAVREQYGSSDRHECGTQREGYSGPTESPRRLRCPRTGTERKGKQRRRGEPIGRRLGGGPP